ncbi:hypothetical protein N9C96_01460 [bacterium]|nr:hypothetical protein [bacterium]
MGNECVKGLGGKVILVVPALQRGFMELLIGLAPVLVFIFVTAALIAPGMCIRPNRKNNSEKFSVGSYDAGDGGGGDSGGD